MIRCKSFKRYIENDANDNYSICFLSKYFNTDPVNMFMFIVDFLIQEINNKETVFKLFKILLDINNLECVNNIGEISNKINKIDLKKIKGRKYRKIISYKIDILNKGLHFINEENNNDLFEFSRYLIFDIKNIELVKELILTFKEIGTIKKEKYLIFEILDNYIKSILIDSNDFYYFDCILNFMLKNCLISNNIKSKLYFALFNLSCDEHKNMYIKRLISNINGSYNPKSVDEVNELYNINSNEAYYDINLLNQENYDLYDRFIISIDKECTRTREDAFSIIKLNNGNFLLEIYSPHVSRYVIEGSEVDIKARNQAESIVTHYNIFTMLPDNLTKNLSLNQGEFRNCLCYRFEFTPNMELVNFDIKKAFVKINLNLSYTSIEELLSDSTNPFVYETLKFAVNFLELSDYNNSKIKNYHDLKTMKRVIQKTNNINRPVGINNVGNRIVNTLKLLLGSHVSSIINKMGYPFVYKVNNSSNAASILKLRNMYVNEESLADIRNAIGVSNYSTNNIGHKGLGLNSYSNFTISLRNYISLADERLICMYLLEKEKLTDKQLVKIEEYLNKLCDEINLRIQINHEYVLQLGKLKKR